MCHVDSPIFPISGGAQVTDADILIETSYAPPLPAFIATPDQRPGPGILLIPDIYGPGEFYRDLARRLAAAGYLTALPDLFSRLEPLDNPTRDELRARNGQIDQTQALTDVHTVLAWLRDHEASTGKLGTIGFCMGGTLVMLAGGRQPVPDASVAFYGFPKRQRTPLNPILASDEDEASTIASPLLALWGDQDHAVGMDNVEAYDAQLSGYGKEHEFIVYPEIGHGFLTFDPDAASYAPSQDAWNRTLAFFSSHLG